MTKLIDRYRTGQGMFEVALGMILLILGMLQLVGHAVSSVL